jgi:hypothetical protein
VSRTLRRAAVATAALSMLVFAAPLLRADAGMELRKALLKATARAIELEMKGYRARLETANAGTGPKENVERFKKRLKELEAERLVYAGMKPEEYPEPSTGTDTSSILDGSHRFGPILPPTLREGRVVIDGVCADGTLLSFDGTSRSGPFYHLSGIRGNNYGILKQGQRYRLTLYLVYKREYFGLISDCYAYIADVQ